MKAYKELFRKTLADAKELCHNRTIKEVLLAQSKGQYVTHDEKIRARKYERAQRLKGK